ncbi:UMP kinase [Halarchaeum sp. CBA1220]|uniref:UMP kinase n=1 Tax=Halarchaeum sp. CBA1220 TaxID=1853682 RepID=UPI000F3A82A2|nr:UMP kinase [Halarchaeum sp. CBA1220]QLC33117.1 UMP kinase [Halarchaeum sp. CBA1220]
MRVVVSVGGSVLAPDLAHERVEQYADVIDRLVDEGCSVGAVVGGGGVARSYIKTARKLGANEVELDDIGISVTRLNAQLLIAALGDDAAPSPAENYEEAGEAMRRGDVAIMGGVTAGQTTDAVSAALAEYTNADLLVYATSVPGVYSADPKTDEDAERYERITPAELVDVIADIEMSAGSSAPVDLLAAKLIERSRVRTIVLDGTEPEDVLDAVLRGEHDGTDIVPNGSEAGMDYWVADEDE